MQAGRFRVCKWTVHALLFWMVAAATEATCSSVSRAFDNPSCVFFPPVAVAEATAAKETGRGARHSIGNRTFLFQNVVEFLNVVFTWRDQRVLLTRDTQKIHGKIIQNTHNEWF